PHAGPRRARGRSPRAALADARGLGRHRHDRSVPAPLPREPAGRGVRPPGGLRAPPRVRGEPGVPPRLRGAVRTILLSGGGSSRRVQVVSKKWATPLAGVVSGLLFALAFPPFGWPILLPLALVPWLVALRREERPGRALWSGFLFGLAFWCASI